VGPDRSCRGLGHRLDESAGLLEFASEFLRSSSTGVDHLKVLQKEISEEEQGRLLPRSVPSKVLEDVAENEGSPARFLVDDDKEVVVDPRGNWNRLRIGRA
jgi:hypothetical protein